MKKHIGTMALACMVIFSLCMPVAKMESKTGGDTDNNDDGGYMFETILSRNEDIQGRPTYIEGYYKLYDDGLALYYSKQDYLYDTRENAVWLPERKDYPLEKMMAYEQACAGRRGNESLYKRGSYLVRINQSHCKRGGAAHFICREPRKGRGGKELRLRSCDPI